MKPTLAQSVIARLLRILRHSGVLPAALLLAASAAPAALLLQQAPTLADDAVRVGSEGQAGRLAETFSFSGSGQQLAWWGTETTAFQVAVYAASDPSSAVLGTTAVTSSATAMTVTIGGDALPVFRYSVDLPALAGGSYIVSVLETALDPLGQTWYWLLGSGGDGAHISGFGEAFEVVDPDGDLALEVLGDPPVSVVPAAAPLWLLLSAVPAGWWATRRSGRRRAARARAGDA